MLREIDESLEALLRAAVPLAATDIDVSFDAPNREWSAKLNRPTVNLFLADIRRSVERARTGVETVERDGQMVRRLALPRVELRYLMTAWTTELSDERELLAGVMRAVLAHATVPAEFQPESLHALTAPMLRLASTERAPIDVIKTLEGQLKPALDVSVTIDIDLGLERPLASPPSTIDTGVGRVGDATPVPTRRVAGDVTVPGCEGVDVVSPRGSAKVNAAGRFLISAAPGDEISLLTDPVRTVVVPEQGGVVIG